MTAESRVTMHKGAAVLIGLALLLAGAGGSYVLMRRADRSGKTAALPTDVPPGPLSDSHTSAARPPTSDSPLPDVIISLPAEAIERAGIAVAPVTRGTTAVEIRLPGVVEPNAYRQVAVTSLVAGRVTRVTAELGARVRRGQALAQIYSPELAEAQTKYVSAKAMLDAHDRELQRTQQLVEIGAASRQELERLHAEHAAQTALVHSARSQLELLGVPAPTVDALGSGGPVNAATSVPAPIDGIVTARAANVGLNVDPATTLFTLVDLSTVWIVADVHERDFSRVRVGSDATITIAAYPRLSLRGRVAYIDPQVNSETRTARARVEVPNPRGELRLGMYADVMVTGDPGAPVALVPRSAVQNVGDRTVVYLANPAQPGTFTEREVRLGEASGELVEVTSGIHAGDRVVTRGSFFIRAERERLDLRPTAGPSTADPGQGPSESRLPGTGDKEQTAKVVVSEQGFEPARVALRAGLPARITFLRATDKTCATEIAFPALDIKRALPLNEPVAIEFTPAKTGEIAFVCGMNMLRGVVAVE